MKIQKIRFIAFLIAIGGVAACSIDEGDNECTYSQQGEFTLVTGPDTAVVNEEITLNVSVKMLRECGTFDEFSQSNGYPKEVYPIIFYPDCGCKVANTFTTVPYTFSASVAGQYELRFQTATNPIIKTITVTE
jgi:hypothetical protein